MLSSPSSALTVRSPAPIQVVSVQKMELVRERDFYNLVKVALLEKTKTDSMQEEHVQRLKKMLSDIMFPEKPKWPLLAIIDNIASDEPDQAEELIPLMQSIIAGRIADEIVKAKRVGSAPEKTKSKPKASKADKPEDAAADDADKQLEIIAVEKGPPQGLANLYLTLGTAEHREALKAEAMQRITQTESKILASVEVQVVAVEKSAANTQTLAALQRRKLEAQEARKGVTNMMARSAARAAPILSIAPGPEYEYPTPSGSSSGSSSRSSSSNNLATPVTGGIFGKFSKSDKPGAPAQTQSAKSPQ